MNASARPGPATSSRLSSIINYSAIGVVASALADATHEILGHLLAAWAVGDRIVSISSVALQTVDESRFVAGAGTTANLAIGSLSLAWAAAPKQGIGSAGTLFSLFLWLFAAFNLLNCGYLVVSAILGSGDWAVVIDGLSATLAWRVALAFIGATLYVRSLHWLTRAMAQLVERKQLNVSDLQRFVKVGYVAGGSVMTLASMYNPVNPTPILVSGVGASFGLFAGLLLIPDTVRQLCSGAAPVPQEATSLSVAWVGLALVVGGSFIVILGPGIHFGAR